MLKTKLKDNNSASDSHMKISNKISYRLYFQDLINHRHILYRLILRNFIIRYKNTALGAIWIVLQPLLSLLILTTVFGSFMGLKYETEYNYTLLILSGMIAWNLVSNIINDASESLFNNRLIITKNYVPKLYFLFVNSIIVLSNSLIEILLFIVIAYFFGVDLHRNLLFIPIFLILAFLLAFGPSLIFSILFIKFHDIKYIIPFLIRLGFFASPIAYSIDFINEKYRFIYSLNPVVGIIDSFRYALINAPFNSQSFAITIIYIVVFNVFGLWFFLNTDNEIADEV